MNGPAAAGSGTQGVSGAAVAAAAAGGVLIWSGLKGAGVSQVLRSVLSGRQPRPVQVNPISGGPGAVAESGGAGQEINVTTPGSGTDAANQALGRLMAAGYGWGSGQNWQALNYGWGTLESGWNANARNPSSGAYGIAQALGHGIAATAAPDGENNYGPDNGVSVATARAANEGSATAQIAWGLAYIRAAYGSPSQVPGWLGQGGYGGY